MNSQIKNKFSSVGGSTQTAMALETVHYNVLRPALENPVSDTETVQVRPQYLSRMDYSTYNFAEIK